ncbi:spore gernimation protein GerQ [Alkalihalobacillus pseudalcaliphilus]|nr:spore coat protein [Alkalihalobacillus pseudalcaliphilus]KMK78340.1 spore gernimation protein GerQ [Alkalihalobacillus pseudalcaliphilus]
MTNMPQNSTQATPTFNHGGHEMFDCHEILAGIINVLDQFMIFRGYMKDPELIQLLDRQYQFLESQYNLIVESFRSGQDPSQGTGQYQMKLSHTVQFGIKPSAPKKPNRNISEVKEAGLSAHMLGLLKSTASTMAMIAVEVTNPVIRRVLADTVPNIIEMAYEVFLYQNKHGYYQVPQLKPADMQAMSTAFTTVSQPATMPSNHQHPLH